MPRTWGVALFCLAAGACTASETEVEPPSDQLFFPTGMATTSTELFVASANSELRYDSGTLDVFDLDKIDAIAKTWTDGSKTIPDAIDADHSCTQDPDHIETLVCDETYFLKVGAGARIGNFATDIAVQDMGAGNSRLIVPTRGDPSIAWADWDGSNLNCNSNGEGFQLCDDAHRLTYVTTDPNLTDIPDEPFFAYADSAGQFAVVTHLTSGAITLIDSPRGGTAAITDVASEVFNADPLTGLRGATGVAGRLPQSPNDVFYVGSRSEDRIQMFTVGRPVNDAPAFLVSGNYFFLDTVGTNSGSSSPGSTDTRGMQFSADGSRLYLINRNPPTLQIFDTSLGDSGFPNNQLVGATDICREGSTLSVMDSGDGDRAYISCFSDGVIYVVDPRGLSQVVDIVQTGRGPYAVAGAPARKKLFVTNFLEDTVAVIDTTPGSASQNRVVLRIGVSKAP
jgi:DNA-binding beta-propeller fold protein YncE